MADLFGAPSAPASEVTTTTEENPIEVVKQKFKDASGELDVVGLAKGKLEADKHIANLESEARGLRKELETRLSYEQFLDEIKSSKATSSQVTTPETNEVKALGKDDIATLVREVVNQERTQTQKDNNVIAARQGLAKVWGSNYEDKLVSKLADIGISKEFAQSIAENNPKAFLKMVDAEVVTRPLEASTAPPLASRTNNASALSGGKRDYSYYEKLRKSDPRQYWHQKTQQQMHNDMFIMGEEFGVKLQ